ncbi:MAG: AAA family ATPase, partial [Verrucomicrobia bacterium]|nr:AAA family ATPase [Verrucomicrobiota bacterium]
IYTITQDTDSSKLLLANLNPDYFNYLPAKYAFQRILTLASKTGKVCEWSAICADPTIDKTYRDLLLNFKAQAIVDSQQSIDILDEYKKARILNHSCSTVLEKLKTQFDSDELLLDLEKALEFARSGNKHELFHIGESNNTRGIVKNILDSAGESNFILSGFPGYDNKTGGLPKKGLHILAAPTGGGKSTVALQLSVNLYRQALSVAYVSLEMGEEQCISRFLSCISGIDHEKIRNRELDKEEKKAIVDSYREHVKYGKSNECRFTVFPPKSEITVSQALFNLKPFGYKVIVLDYIGLFDGMDEQDQWRAMMKATKQCKRFSDVNDCLVVLLAQLDENEFKLKFSRSLKDHADIVWMFHIKEENKDVGEFDMNQTKGRDAISFSFPLSFDFAIKRVWDKTVVGTNGSKGRTVLDSVDDEIQGLSSLTGDFES